MANKDYIAISGLEQHIRQIEQLSTESPGMRKALQAVIRKAINEARQNIIKDARSALENDPRHAYRAVRNSVYKQILGGQVNILSSRRRGAPTKWERPRTLQPGQRGGNRRPRSLRTMQVESYEGKDRGFILRFLNAGTAERNTRYGSRGHIAPRPWFRISSAFQVDAAANRVAEEIERMIAQEFKYI